VLQVVSILILMRKMEYNEWLIKEDKVVYTGAYNDLSVWHSSYEKDVLFNYALRD